MSLDNLTETQQAFADSLEQAGIPITESAIQAKFEAMASDAGLVFQNPGEQSAWWRWLRAIAVAPALWLIEYLVKEVLPGLFIKTATGPYLKLHGWRLGMDKKEVKKAVGMIRFWRDSQGAALTIPAGTIIQTAPINGMVYQVHTTEDGLFAAQDSEITLAVEALATGSAYNLAANYYIILAEPIAGVSGVTNDADWLTTPGTDEESDDSYRERLRGSFSSIADFHIDAVYKTIVSEYSGIEYTRIFIDRTLAPRGPGSADAFILFDVGQPAQRYIDSINDYLVNEGMHGLGDDFQVKALPDTLHDIAVTVWVPKNTVQTVKDTLQTNIEQMIRCAFRENAAYDVTQTWPTKRFSFGRLTGEILKRLDGIESMEWGLSDIVSGWDIARIHTLTITISEVD